MLNIKKPVGIHKNILFNEAIKFTLKKYSYYKS